MGKSPQEEEEEEDDSGPIDTKSECEESCKPRCVKQLLVYQVSFFSPNMVLDGHKNHYILLLVNRTA